MTFRKLAAIGVVAVSASVAMGTHAHAQTERTLSGFQCMSLAHLWNGEGSMPPVVHEYASPAANAPKVGIAIATVVVDDPPKAENGRVRVIRPNGSAAWIAGTAIAPWRVASNPNARCVVVERANGMVVTTSH